MLCTGCQGDLPEASFAKDRYRKSGLRHRCRACSAREFKAWQATPGYAERLLRGQHARLKLKLENPRKRWSDVVRANVARRAKQAGVEFTLTEEWLLQNAVERCPLMGFELDYAATKSGRNSPSVDRRDPAKGYTPDNCWVISHFANRIKSDATIEDIERLAHNLRLYLDA